MTLNELRELSDKATSGPWGAYISYSGESGTPDEVGLFVNDKARTTDFDQRNIVSDFGLYASEALPDLEFAAAAVNYVRAVLADIRLVDKSLRVAARALADATAFEHADCTYPPCKWCGLSQDVRAALSREEPHDI